MPVLIEEVEDEPAADQKYTFHHLPDAQFQTIGNPAIQPFLAKWGFGPDMAMCTFRVEQVVSQDGMQAMLDAFFTDRRVLAVLHAVFRLRVFSPERVRVRWERMSTKAVSMSFLNKFEECGAITRTGRIQGRIEEWLEDVPITNLLREAILMEESELYDSFSEQDRKEFLFRIFSHVVFGGASNQEEDMVEEYLKVTKSVYKDLLTVRRNDTGDVEVTSPVASIVSLGAGGTLFPKENPLNFCYVIHDPQVRHLRVWYFGYRPIW